MPEQALCDIQVSPGALGMVRFERSSRAPSTAHTPGALQPLLQLQHCPGSAVGHRALREHTEPAQCILQLNPKAS